MASDLDRRVEELASRQHGVFSTRQVLLLGGNTSFVQHRCENGRWCRTAHGVLRLLGTETTFESEVMAAVLGARTAAVASHRCAAALFGLPGMRRQSVELTTLPGGVLRRRGVLAHRTNTLPNSQQTIVRGIPCTSIGRTLMDLTAVLHPRRVERLVDHCLSRKMVSFEALSRVYLEVAKPGRRKLVVFRDLLDARGPDYVPPESELEARFVALTREAGLPVPERQVDLGDGNAWIGRVDFLFRSARVVVEVDGARFHSGLVDRRRDADRDRRLQAAGFRVQRFGWSEVVDQPRRVVQRLQEVMSGSPSRESWTQGSRRRAEVVGGVDGAGVGEVTPGR
ncbi:MAG: DUF559 domain-containing protein [Actinobacteria bacterium]|nr:DUF559 domain-containing protein [Actinomycetota bacterium]